MRVIYLAFLLASCIQVEAQSLEDVVKLYQQSKYPEALDVAHQILLRDPSDASVNYMTGRIFTDFDKPDSARPYLLKAIALDGDLSYVSDWSHAYLGKVLLLSGEKDNGIAELNKAIEMNLTARCVQYARQQLALISYVPDKKSTVTKSETVKIEVKPVKMEGEHITYYFMDTSGLSVFVQQYITSHENAYNKINKVFQAVLPQKMCFYIWKTREAADRDIHQQLGFTDPQSCSSYVLISQTVGHEMTHTLSYWGWGEEPVARGRFINEGVAVAFDNSGSDKYEDARNALKGKDIHSVTDIWLDEKKADEGILYPVGGAFLTYLFEKSTADQFRMLIKNQTIKSAEKIYGKDHFKEMIAAFNKRILS